ncbi:unnamed protein product [Gongylonema pulchrum]|uniref:Uncharacterized protein n=1 Tax=Gongylonema pulchrum TaxID=637853 RepID=A0A183CZ88_9BILA|nr:unnamed protein product [Gongylonema pulchrum]
MNASCYYDELRKTVSEFAGSDCFQQGLLRYRSSVLCKLLTFIAHFCDFSSVWLIVLVGFERLVLLYRSS